MPISNIQALRYLINDQSSLEFEDAGMQSFLDAAASIESSAAATRISGDGNLLLAASLATQALVVKYGSSPTQAVMIGGFQTSSSFGRNQSRDLGAQAERFYQMYIDTPAFAIAEDNNSGFNELTIIRNWVLRHTV